MVVVAVVAVPSAYVREDLGKLRRVVSVRLDDVVLSLCLNNHMCSLCAVLLLSTLFPQLSLLSNPHIILSPRLEKQMIITRCYARWLSTAQLNTNDESISSCFTFVHFLFFPFLPTSASHTFWPLETKNRPNSRYVSSCSSALR